MLILGKYKLSRRTFLRGALAGASAAVALPALEAMLDTNGAMYASGQPIPKRFGVFFWGNGIIGSRWVPSSPGVGDGWQLSEELTPLAPVKSHLSVITGHRVWTPNLRGHHAGAAGILSGAAILPQDPNGAGYASTFTQPSIDVLLSGELGQQTRYNALHVGVDERVTYGEGTTLGYLSHNGPDSVNPAEFNPSALFSRIFGDGFVAPGETRDIDPTLKVRRNILDAVSEDARRLERRLGAADKARMEQHLDGLSSLQRRLQTIEDATPIITPSCKRPADPGNPATNSTQGQRDRSRAMADLLAMAMACDLTRVFTNQFSGSVAGTHYWDIEPVINFHQLTHDEPGDQPKVHACVMFIMEELSYLMQALHAMPEGDGTLLDHSAVLATSDLSSGREHSLTEYPILIGGKAGGALKGDVHHRALGANASEVGLTLLRAMGSSRSEFGTEAGRVTKVISQLMT
jgi:hypothetical protein